MQNQPWSQVEGESICINNQKPLDLSPYEECEENQDLGQCGDPCYMVGRLDRETLVALSNASLLFFFLFFFTTPAFQNDVCCLS